MTTTYRISEVAAQTGFSPATLRYYEEIRIVPAAGRSEAGYRIYDKRSLGRLAFVARAKQLGLSLEEVGALTRLWDGDECGPVQQRMGDFVAHKLAATHERVVEMMALAGQLQAVAARLDDKPQAGPCDQTCACISDTAPAPVSDGMGTTDPAADAEVACTLDAADRPGRLADWRSLMRRATGPERIAGGLRFRFPAEAGLAAIVADLAQAEQTCCAFLRFTVSVGAGTIRLDILAPIGAEAIVDGLFQTAS